MPLLPRRRAQEEAASGFDDGPRPASPFSSYARGFLQPIPNQARRDASTAEAILGVAFRDGRSDSDVSFDVSFRGRSYSDASAGGNESPGSSQPPIGSGGGPAGGPAVGSTSAPSRPLGAPSGYARLLRHLLFSVANLALALGVGTVCFAYLEDKPW